MTCKQRSGKKAEGNSLPPAFPLPGITFSGITLSGIISQPMITIYHNIDPEAPRRLADPAAWEQDRPEAHGLELAAVVHDTDDIAEAFDRVIHRDGENWTDTGGVTSFGDPRGRRSSQEGDVFVTGDGHAHLVLPAGFRALPGLRLPFLPGTNPKGPF